MALLNAVLGLAVVWLVAGVEGKIQRIPSRQCLKPPPNKTIYDFNAEEFWGMRNISLSDFKGKIVVIVNVATF